MNIWVIGRNYPLPENGAQGSFELEQAQMLCRLGNKVHYLACCLHPYKKVKNRGIQSWQDSGLSIRVLSAFYLPRIYPIYFVKGRNQLWKKLFEAVEEEDGIPDIIHVHYPAMLMIAEALQSYRNRGVKIVATEHWSKVLKKNLNSAEIREYKKYTKVLNSIICVGEPLKKAVQDLTGMEGIIVPNIVNSCFKPVEVQHDDLRFVAVGRLIKLKQFDRIIEAFSDTFSRDENVSLTIVGCGKELPRLQKLASQRKAKNQIQFLGRLDRNQTAQVVSKSDALICYSRLETFGVPVIEAWACGIPVIASSAIAVVKPWQSRLGIEVSPDDYEGLKIAMRYIYEHRDDYNKTDIRQYALLHFSDEVVSQRLMDIYQQC